MLGSLSVEEIMTSDVDVLGRSASARTVARTLREGDVGAVIVDGDPRGIVTQTDVVDLLASGRDAAAVSASEMMSSPLVTIAPDATIEDAVREMAHHGVERLVVTEAEEIVGVVTTGEVSYYVPKLVPGRPEERGESDPRIGVSYAEEGWEFEHEDRETRGEIDVGDRVRFTKQIDDADVRAFAEASGDTNRLHLDESYAARTRFGGRIVHGLLAAGLISAALARIPGLTIYLSQDLSFREPVDVGETVTAICEFVKSLGADRYRLTTRLYGADGEVAIDGTATVMMLSVPA